MSTVAPSILVLLLVFFYFGIILYTLWWSLMAQLVELGTQSFKASRGQCLVSRATATLIRGDKPNATESIYDKFEFWNAWVTLKQELIVDVYIEALLDPVMSVPSFVEQVVESVQASLIKQINDNPYLRLSTIHHESRSLTDSVALHVSVILSKVPDLSPELLPRRLPRRVKECAAEPHQPPGVDTATLSHIAIYMQTREITQYPNPGVKCVQHSNCLSNPETSKSVMKYADLNDMVYCSLQYLVNGYSLQHKYKSITAEGPSLSDMAPVFFKPGHYELESTPEGWTFTGGYQINGKDISVMSVIQLKREDDLRQIEFEGTLWKLYGYRKYGALQRGAYKVEWPKSSLDEEILLGDDDLLAEDFDLYDDCDRQMLDSSIDSETGSDNILSHCGDDIEPDSGYSSLSSPEKLFPGFLELDSLYGEIHDDSTSGESAIDDNESDLVLRPDTEGEDMIRSSSLPPAVSDMGADEDVTTYLLLSSEGLSQDDRDGCGDQHDEDMMDISSSISIISSSTYQSISDVETRNGGQTGA